MEALDIGKEGQAHTAAAYHPHDGGGPDIDLHTVEKPGEKAAQAGGQDRLRHPLGESSPHRLQTLHTVLGHVFHGLHKSPNHEGKAGDAQGHEAHTGADAQGGEQDEGPHQGGDIAQEGGKAPYHLGKAGEGRDLFAAEQGYEEGQDGCHRGGGHSQSQRHQHTGKDAGNPAGRGQSGGQEILCDKFPESVPIGHQHHGIKLRQAAAKQKQHHSCQQESGVEPL